MRKLVLAVLLLSSLGWAQTSYKLPSLSAANRWTGKQTFSDVDILGALTCNGVPCGFTTLTNVTSDGNNVSIKNGGTAQSLGIYSADDASTGWERFGIVLQGGRWKVGSFAGVGIDFATIQKSIDISLNGGVLTLGTGGTVMGPASDGCATWASGVLGTTGSSCSPDLSGTYEPKNANIQTHISSTSNPHSVTAAQAGAVPTTRQVIAGAGLTGGGALSGDVTLTLAAQPYDVGVFLSTLTISKSNLNLKIPRAWTLPTSLTGSYCGIGTDGTNPSGSIVVSLRKANVEFGTATFATDGTCALASGSGATFAAGDFYNVTMPADVKGAAGLSITLAGTR